MGKMCIRDRFKNDSISSITVSGIRCQDMRLRLKYVDIPTALEADVEKAVRGRIEDGCGNLYVLVNYTCLLYTSYEILKLAGSSDNALINLFSKPGLAIQKLTTKEPDEGMIEVAIQAVEAVFDWRAYEEENFDASADL